MNEHEKKKHFKSKLFGTRIKKERPNHKMVMVLHGRNTIHKTNFYEKAIKKHFYPFNLPLLKVKYFLQI